jgi:hypothetical protein
MKVGLRVARRAPSKAVSSDSWWADQWVEMKVGTMMQK